MITATKTCLSCSRTLHGRADKKFCNDYCRNAHHNLANYDTNNYVRIIDSCLKRNRRILESFLYPVKSIAHISRQALQQKGFSFRHYTHTQANKKGNAYFFCYEFGYRLLEEQVIIIKRKNHQ